MIIIIMDDTCFLSGVLRNALDQVAVPNEVSSKERVTEEHKTPLLKHTQGE